MKNKSILSLLLLLTTTSIAAPTIIEKTNYYKISGTTADALRAQMNLLGPLDKNGQRNDAKTDWYVNWHYEWHYDTPTQNGCHLTLASTTVTITSTLPEWTNETQSTPELQTVWNNYMAHLETHEAGHAENGKSTAMDVEKALYSVSPQPNCLILKALLEKAAKEVINLHNAWDIKYDRDTDHGKTQDARFP